MSQLEGLGFSPNFISGFRSGGTYVPLMSISGYLGVGGNNLQDTRVAAVWEFGGDYTKIVGRHTFKSGREFRQQQYRLTDLWRGYRVRFRRDLESA